MSVEAPITSLVWISSIVSVVLTYVVSYLIIPSLGPGHDTTLWWKLATIITCGTLAGAVIPELVKVFTSTESAHAKEGATSPEEGAPGLKIFSGLAAGNFSAYWLGMGHVSPMAVA